MDRDDGELHSKWVRHGTNHYNSMTLLWRHMSVMAYHTTGNWIVCSLTVYPTLGYKGMLWRRHDTKHCSHFCGGITSPNSFKIMLAMQTSHDFLFAGPNHLFNKHSGGQWNVTRRYWWFMPNKIDRPVFTNSHNWQSHDDVIKWKYFPRNWPFVVNFPHKGQ